MTKMHFVLIPIAFHYNSIDNVAIAANFCCCCSPDVAHEMSVAAVAAAAAAASDDVMTSHQSIPSQPITCG